MPSVVAYTIASDYILDIPLLPVTS